MFRMRFILRMMTTVPLSATAHGVVEWLEPTARIGLGYFSASRRIAIISCTFSASTTTAGDDVMSANQLCTCWLLMLYSSRSVDISGFRSWPGSERILDAAEHRLQVREMSQQDGGHIVVDNPVEANLRVDFGVVIRREEPIALQPSRRHE